MPLYLEIIFTIIGFILSTVGVVLGSKALYNIKESNKQKNKHGDNYQNSTINHQGLNADDVINVLNKMSAKDLEKIKSEFDIKLKMVDEELKKIPTWEVVGEEPKNPKEGTIWLDTSEK